ncbi:MAG: hypothetical protein ABEI78_00960 [Candidatus Nanohaloarchaea archaeon]
MSTLQKYSCNLSFQIKKYLSKEKETYVPSPKIPVKKAINKIQENGGATSLAHPGRSLTKNQAQQIIPELKQKGLDAIEVKYTYQQKKNISSININFKEKYADKLAEKHNLLKTGGSDCHGSGTDKYLIGQTKIDNEKVEKIREKSRKHRENQKR